MSKAINLACGCQGHEWCGPTLDLCWRVASKPIWPGSRIDYIIRKSALVIYDTVHNFGRVRSCA